MKVIHLILMYDINSITVLQQAKIFLSLFKMTQHGKKYYTQVS